MTTRLLWAALMVLALVSASGCGEVESCDRGTVGCLDGPSDPTSEKPCKFGLEENSEGNCVKKAGGGGVTPGDDCNCPSGSLCNDAKQCVNVCDLPSNLPAVKTAPLACRPNTELGEAPYDFTKASQAACSQECIRRAEYCGVACDPATACTAQLAVQILSAPMVCPGGNTECAMALCESLRDRPCSQYSCAPSPNSPNCVGVTCTNSCVGGFQDYVNDGYCDDGDLSNAQSAECQWGSDCGDCGPRRGVAPRTTGFGLGEICVHSSQCGGDQEDVRNAEGWCAQVPTTGLTLLRCLPDCSTTQQCPAGYVCNDLQYEENGVRTPATDEAGRPARACFSLQCGA